LQLAVNELEFVKERNHAYYFVATWRATRRDHPVVFATCDLNTNGDSSPT